MYEQFYALHEKPFALTPDPAYLYLAKRHRHALTMLEYSLSQACGFAPGNFRPCYIQRFLCMLH